MIFVKSVLAGLAALVISVAIMYCVSVFVLPPIMAFVMTGDEGGAGAVNTGPFSVWWLVGVALLIFAAGFYWNFRRSLRNRRIKADLL